MKSAILIMTFGIAILSVYSVDAQLMLNITTDKTVYIPNDIIQLTITTSEIIPYTGIQYQITDSQDVITHQGNAYPDETNTTTVDVHLTALTIPGSYNIQATYRDVTLSYPFTVTSEALELSRLSISVDAGYLRGETITLTGKLNKIWTPALNIKIDQTSTQSKLHDISGLLFEISDVVRLDGYGSFTYSFDIPDDPIHLGTYSVTVSGVSVSASTIFSLVDDLEDIDVISSVLSIKTDKLVYKIGDVINVSGQLDTLRSEPADLINVNIYRDREYIQQSDDIRNAIISSSSALSYSRVSLPDTAGRFSFSDTLYQSAFSPGKYVMTAATSISRFTTSTAFEIISDDLVFGTIDLDFNKKIIGANDTIIVNGFVPGVSQGISTLITLTMPDATQLEFDVFADDFNFLWEWTVPTYASEADQENLFGIYRVDVDTEQTTVTDFFKVSKNPENDSIDLNHFKVSSDKLFYAVNDLITINGKIPLVAFTNSEFSSDDLVTIKIQTPEFAVLDTSKVFIKKNGIFTSSFTLNPLILEYGRYLISVSYLDYTVKTDFVIYDKSSPPISLSTDRLNYTPNDNVSITLVAPLNAQLGDVHVYIYASATSTDCNRNACDLIYSSTISDTQSNSTTFIYTIPNDTIYITYHINAQKLDAKHSVVFFNTPITPSVDDEPYLTLVKSERITSDSISIKVSDTRIDSKSAKPLVVRGSLFTPIRDVNPDVNLRVEHNGGVCIIGQASECMINDTTRGVDSLYTVIQIDGIDYNVRYNGPNSILEQFSILDLSENTLSESVWNVTIDSEHPTRFYHTILYSVE